MKTVNNNTISWIKHYGYPLQRIVVLLFHLELNGECIIQSYCWIDSNELERWRIVDTRWRIVDEWWRIVDTRWRIVDTRGQLRWDIMIEIDYHRFSWFIQYDRAYWSSVFLGIVESLWYLFQKVFLMIDSVQIRVQFDVCFIE